MRVTSHSDHTGPSVYSRHWEIISETGEQSCTQTDVIWSTSSTCNLQMWSLSKGDSSVRDSGWSKYGASDTSEKYTQQHSWTWVWSGPGRTGKHFRSSLSSILHCDKISLSKLGDLWTNIAFQPAGYTCSLCSRWTDCIYFWLRADHNVNKKTSSCGHNAEILH